MLGDRDFNLLASLKTNVDLQSALPTILGRAFLGHSTPVYFQVGFLDISHACEGSFAAWHKLHMYLEVSTRYNQEFTCTHRYKGSHSLIHFMFCKFTNGHTNTKPLEIPSRYLSLPPLKRMAVARTRWIAVGL